MLISVVNQTKGSVSDEELQRVIRAINRQINEDFAPYWHLRATLRLEGHVSDTVDKELPVPPDLRGDSMLYLWDEADVAGALGYHNNTAAGVPSGFVFTSLSREMGEPWSVTLSHEALELIGDSETNLLVMGKHPNEDRQVFHWLEMCDAVQAETYEIDGIAVSNFVLPLYFAQREQPVTGARNDFLGRAHNNETLKPFGINPGGYIGFCDPQLQRNDTFTRAKDDEAEKRMEVKGRAAQARRSQRYIAAEEKIAVKETPRAAAMAATATKTAATYVSIRDAKREAYAPKP